MADGTITDYGGGGDTSSFDYGGALSAGGSIIGGIGSYLSGQATATADKYAAKADLARQQGYEQESTAYTEAAGYAQGNVDLAKESTAIKEYQTSRQINAVIGKQRAQVGGAGFTESGTGLYLLRASAAQGALATGLVGVQGAIQEQGYAAQVAADTALSTEATTAADAAGVAAQGAEKAASAASTAGTLGLISGIIGGVVKAAALF